MPKNPEITPRLLREFIRYQPDTGKMFWLKRAERHFDTPATAFFWNVENEGLEIFTRTNANGYCVHGIMGETLLAHRVVWALHHNEWPTAIDHINGQKRDNRLCNLRPASGTVNARNRVMGSNNTSGYTGVYKEKSGNYSANILGKHLGTFPTREDAAEARKAAQREAPAFTERHGLPRIGTAIVRKSRRAKKEYTVIKYA